MASKRHLRRKACEGKLRHETQEIAHASLRSLASRGRFTGGMHVYKCAFCHGWHLGHNTYGHGARPVQGAQHYEALKIGA